MGVRRSPGEVRDAIINYLKSRRGDDASVDEIYDAVKRALGSDLPRSSVRSYLGLAEGRHFERTQRGRYRIRTP
jgi:hypothetical protein